MSISDILKNNLSKETRERVIKLAQYFYLTNRISYGCFLYIIAKPFYQLLAIFAKTLRFLWLNTF